MATKNYYIILGVSRSESSRGIHEAFRRLAKKYHPDLGGQEATRAGAKVDYNGRSVATVKKIELDFSCPVQGRFRVRGSRYANDIHSYRSQKKIKRRD